MNDFFSIRKDGASTFLHGYLEEEGNTTLHKQTKQAKCHSLRQDYFAIWGEIIFCKILKDMLCFAEHGIISQQLMQENMASPTIPQLHEYGDEGFLRRGHNL